MSFGDYITEIRVSELELEKILYLIKRDCKPYLKRIKGAQDFLWRGIDKKLDDITEIVPRKNRYPKDTPEDIHYLLDGLFKNRFGWHARSEGVFCYAKRASVAGYGDPYMVFPTGNNWGFLWNKNVNDLYSEAKDHWEFGMEPSEDMYYEQYGDDTGNGNWEFQGQNADDPSELALELADAYKTDCESEAEEHCGEEPPVEQGELFPGEFGSREDWQNCWENRVDECMRDKVNDAYDDISSYREWKPELSWEEYADEWTRDNGPQQLEDKLEDIVKGYSNKGLKKAIVTNNEIMLQCDSYYSISKKVELPLKQEFLQGKIISTGYVSQLGWESERKLKAKVRKM